MLFIEEGRVLPIIQPCQTKLDIQATKRDEEGKLIINKEELGEWMNDEETTLNSRYALDGEVERDENTVMDEKGNRVVSFEMFQTKSNREYTPLQQRVAVLNMTMAGKAKAVCEGCAEDLCSPGTPMI